MQFNNTGLKNILVAAAVFAMNSSVAHAYLFGTMTAEKKLSGSVPTHVLVVGQSDGSGAQFLDAAIARGARYLESDPGSQVIVFKNHEVIKAKKASHTDDISDKKDEDPGHVDYAADVASLEKRGVRILMDNDYAMNGTEVVRVLLGYKRIASIDMYGHSSVHLGLGLENSANRINYNTPGLNRLAGHFTKDAYATINSCNSGYWFAPRLAYAWKIPVSGSFTGTDFEELYDDGSWHFNNPGMYPAGARTVSVNKLSYENGRACAEGACRRMRPENRGYRGMWAPQGASFEAGLGFYKFFCDMKGTGQDKCYMGMARGVMSYPSVVPLNVQSSWDDIKFGLYDYLCPPATSASKSVRRGTPAASGSDVWLSSTPTDARDRCVQAIQNSDVTGNLVFNAFNGTPLECGYSGCDFTLTFKNPYKETVTCGPNGCSAPPAEPTADGKPAEKKPYALMSTEHSFNITAPKNDKPTALLREYHELIHAFSVLKAKTR